MKKLMIVISISFTLTACDFFKSKTEPAPSPSPSSTNSQESMTEPAPANKNCELFALAKPASLAVWKMENGAEFIICDFGVEARLDENSFAGWVNLAQRKDNKIIPLLPEVNSEKINDIYSYSIQKTSATEIKIYRVIPTDDKTPITERKITCSGKGECEFSKEICMKFKKETLVDKDSIATVQKVVSGKLKIEEVEYYDVIIGKLIQSGIAGDAAAKTLMLNTSKDKLKVDGASAEVYEDGKVLLDKLQELGCI